MEIKYDKTIDAKYVRIKDGKIAHTKKEQDWLLFDCAENGDVLGIEILDASRHFVSLFSIMGKLLGYSVVDYKTFLNDNKTPELTTKSPESNERDSFIPNKKPIFA
jgi:uncharacterized protein YuzE